MRADLINKTKTLTGTSDLTLLAPLRSGLVPSLEAVSYKTRAQRVLKLLNGTRASSHEFALHRPLSDSAERVARIHSVRVLVFEPEDLVLLSVTFDGTWESYLRVLWQKVGTLLDVIFCNTEEYVLSTASYDEWCGWVRRVQRDTGFFFSTHALTVQDVHVLRAEEQVHRSVSDPALAQLLGTRVFGRSAEDIAYDAGQTTSERAVDTLRQGLQALALLHRMTDLYLPGSEDGDVLLRAARDLLLEFCRVAEDPHIWKDIQDSMRARFDRQLTWLGSGRRAKDIPSRQPPALPREPAMADPADVQAGIFAGYENANAGCLVLVAFDDAEACARLLARLRESRSIESECADAFTQPSPKRTGAGPFYNIGFTHEGLRRAGLTEQELAEWFPLEFREGMEARASVLGDLRVNHPRRWHLPRMNWDLAPNASAVDVPLWAVHAIVQIRKQIESADHVNLERPEARDYGLRAEVEVIATSRGTQVLSVEGMRRRYQDGKVTEHFGFADGGAQPEFVAGERRENQVQLGEVLLGYPNEADPAPQARSAIDQQRLDFLHNGSFLVVRKLRQDVKLLNRLVDAAVEELNRRRPGGRPFDREFILARMMGRWRQGRSLMDCQDAPQANALFDQNFDFSDDEAGIKCPLHAHIRRVNPRLPRAGRHDPPGGRRARILRRGMSYGREDDEGQDRGLMFMAYNASIAEQFEVVQRWISGGNSSGGYSGQSDPFLGVPEPGQRRHFRFEVPIVPAAGGTGQPASEVVIVPLDTGPDVFGEPEPIVRLEWGAYLFVPSMHALHDLQQRAAAIGARPLPGGWRADAGARQIAALEACTAARNTALTIQAWKCAIEDPGAEERLQAASLWAAVREHESGALRTPYGVLVGSGKLIHEVLSDDRRFSVCGQFERMRASEFDIYLGLDDGKQYQELSHDVNKAIMAISREDAFTLAASGAEAALRSLISAEQGFALKLGHTRWELNLDAREIFDSVLQRLCQEWLGLPRRGGALRPDGWRWDWREGQAPIYPMHFTPPSRYFFQPSPSEDVRDYGRRTGRAVVAAIQELIAPHRAAGTAPAAPGGQEAPLARAILEALRTNPDDAVVARSIAGTLMGFLPTLDGNLRGVLNEWLRVHTFWSLRARWAADAAPHSLDKAERLIGPALRAAMQFAPAPALIWRTAQVDGDRIGPVELRRGDIVVLGLVSAMHEASEARSPHDARCPDVMPVFGGDRRAAGHPTHACPGYEAAMGVLLGTLAAFVDLAETIRPTPAAGSFTIEGRMEDAL